MKYKHAYAGVKKVFAAQIIYILAVLVTIAFGVIAFVAANAETVSQGLAAGTLALIATSGVLTVVCLILTLIGLGQAGKDEDWFKRAFWCSIALLVLEIISSVFTYLTTNASINFPPVVASITDTVAGVLSIFVLLFTLSGIINLAETLKDERMVSKGRWMLWIIVILYVGAVVLSFLPGVLKSETAIAVIGVISAVAELVIYLLYVSYLGQAVRMLKE